MTYGTVTIRRRSTRPFMQLSVRRLTSTARLPVRATEHASCFDVYADMDGVIRPGERLLVKTGLSVAVPPGYEVQVRSRSGLALKQGVAVLNADDPLVAAFAAAHRGMNHQARH